MHQIWTLFWRVSARDTNGVFGDIGATHTHLMEAVQSFVRVVIDIHGRGLAPVIHVWKATKNSEPVDAYPESRYVVILMKAENQRRPPPLDLCSFGLDMKGGSLVLAIPEAPAGPGALIDAITRGCVAQGRLAAHNITSIITILHAW